MAGQFSLDYDKWMKGFDSLPPLRFQAFVLSWVCFWHGWSALVRIQPAQRSNRHRAHRVYTERQSGMHNPQCVRKSHWAAILNELSEHYRILITVLFKEWSTVTKLSSSIENPKQPLSICASRRYYWMWDILYIRTIQLHIQLGQILKPGHRDWLDIFSGVEYH